MKESAELNSTSLQWLLEFNVNELLPEDYEIAPEPDMSTRKSTRTPRACSKKTPYSEEVHLEDEEYMDPASTSSPPPAVARFEECSSSSCSETASDGSEKKQKKRRISKCSSNVAGGRCLESENHSTIDESNKPRCTYTELIERALHEHPEGLTVSQIYSWIAKNHAFFRLDDDRWKNSVRHNLSINPYFEKRGKCKNGAGHVWTIAESCRKNATQETTGVEQYEMDTHEKPAPYEKQSRSNQFKTETERIVGGILQQYKIELNNNRTQQRKGEHGKRIDEEIEAQEGESEIRTRADNDAPQNASHSQHFEQQQQPQPSHSPIVNEHEDLLITTGLRQNCPNDHFSGVNGFDPQHYIDYSELFAPQPQSATVVASAASSHPGHAFNEFELLTLEALEANNNQDNFIIISSNGHENTSNGHDHNGESMAMDTGYYSSSEHHELANHLIEIQTDHLFHTKELLLADEDDTQITTMQL